jgi:quercetin dioxygenase-like cupin family protein
MDVAGLIAAARVILSGSQSESTAMGAKLRAGALRERLGLLSDFTITNLMELENVAAQRTAQVDARFARAHIDSEHLGVSYFRYEPSYRSQTGHSHTEQEEAYVVIGGSGRVKLDDEVRELRRWDVVRVAPHVVRAFEAGPEGLELIVVGSDRPEEGDGTLVSDWWTDY